MDEELYLATYGSECKFSTVLSDGTRIDLAPDGENQNVTSSDRHRFAFLMREARMTESVKQVSKNEATKRDQGALVVLVVVHVQQKRNV
jgi:hypothetical protein